MKKPKLPLGAALGRALAELAIIVAGVLIALAAQSWWEGQGERMERTQALSALHADLAPIRRALVADSLNASRMVASLLRVVRGEDLATLTDSALIVTVASVTWHHLGDGGIDYPAYRDLENSGRFGLIPDEVRLAVSEYAESLRRRVPAFEDLMTFQSTQLDPWVVREFEAAQIIWTPSMGFAYPGRPDYGPLTTREGRNLAATKYSMTIELLRRVEEQLVRTDSILVVLERALANR